MEGCGGVKPKSKSFKCELVKRGSVQGLAFAPTLGRRGYWEEQINLLRGDPDGMLRLNADDTSSLMQLRKRAKDAKLQLLFARDGEYLYVRAHIPSEEQHRLILLLREPRTVNELKARGIEVNLEAELQALATKGWAEFKGGKWRLTPKGEGDLLK